LPDFYINRLENPSESQLISAIINKVKKQSSTSIESATELLKQLIEKHISDTGKTWIRNYSNVDKNGRIYFAKDLSTPGKPNSLVIDELGISLDALKTRGWSSKEKIISLHKQNKLVFKGKRPYEIDFLDDAVDNISSLQDFYSRHGTNDLKKMNLDGLFDTPKPVELIKFLIRSSQHKDALILDFYAGSGTTAQAVYEVNLEDKKNHKFILIQLDETINPITEPFKILKSFGYENPKVSDALFLRLNTFLKIRNIERDYIVVNKVYE
jgi:adenine-specific DNA-methyltransferase